MRRVVQTLAIAAICLTPALAAQAQVSFDVRIGAPPAPRAYHVPRQPGPDYAWIEGYWYPQGSHYKWHDGYWTRPPRAGAYWVQPYHANGQYVAGRWEDGRGNIAHDHHWDKGKQRDERRDPPPSGHHDGHR